MEASPRPFPRRTPVIAWVRSSVPDAASMKPLSAIVSSTVLVPAPAVVIRVPATTRLEPIEAPHAMPIAVDPEGRSGADGKCGGVARGVADGDRSGSHIGQGRRAALTTRPAKVASVRARVPTHPIVHRADGEHRDAGERKGVGRIIFKNSPYGPMPR